MRKILSVALVMLMILAVATASFAAAPSPTPADRFGVDIGTEGSGNVTVSDPDENGVVTITATDKDGFFTRWIITGADYDIVEGSLSTPVIKIKPQGDIKVTGSFSADKDNLTITVDTVGDGEASADPTTVKKGSNDTVTLTATETGPKFEGWVLACDYEIVSGDLTSKTLVIRPLTDVHATAYFGTTPPASDAGVNKGSTSPATGDYTVLMITMVLAAMGLGLFAVKKIKE